VSFVFSYVTPHFYDVQKFELSYFFLHKNTRQALAGGAIKDFDSLEILWMGLIALLISLFCEGK
jgi:hypothetical protein